MPPAGQTLQPTELDILMSGKAVGDHTLVVALGALSDWREELRESATAPMSDIHFNLKCLNINSDIPS